MEYCLLGYLKFNVCASNPLNVCDMKYAIKRKNFIVFISRFIDAQNPSHVMCYRLRRKICNPTVFVAYVGSVVGLTTIVCFMSLFLLLQLPFQHLLWFYTKEIILRWKKVSVIIWNFRNFVSVTITVSTRLLFFISFWSPWFKIPTSQMISHFLEQ